MTKSGIGTNSTANPTQPTSLTQAPQTNQTTSASIANAEIPIWISDRKKWVTGISKKTTINDLIYAILKQCHLIGANSASENINTSSQLEQIANQYVLIEYQFEPPSNSTNNNEPSPDQTQTQLTIKSQGILNGDTKVYKYLNKWSQSPNTNINTNSNVMLKILQRQAENSDLSEKETNNSSSSGQQQSSTSLATKLLKKFGVSSNNSQAQANSSANNSATPNSKTLTSSVSLNSNLSNATFRYVDVKLPQMSQPQAQKQQQTWLEQQQQQHHQQQQSLSPGSNITASSSSTLNQRVFDPNLQKTFLFNSIIERESKLKQQTERCQLLDELIKETEKKSKHSTATNLFSTLSISNTNNPTYSAYSPLSSVSNASASNSSSPNSDLLTKTSSSNNLNKQQQMNIVDLNDIYCQFPEMCTHNLEDVENFTRMCCQLFQLEEAIKSQKQILSGLEHDLQRELNPNQALAAAVSPVAHQSSASANESPETLELRKEVNLSREKTRMQCKQLHDLDLCMRQNEQSLMSKEQELHQLLEAMLVEEIYTENALEKAITNTNKSSANGSMQPKLAAYSPLNQFGHSENNNHKDQSNPEDESATIHINEDVNEFENESEAKQLRMQQQAIELKINNESKMLMMMNEQAKRQQQQQQQQQNHHHQQQIPIVNSAYFNDDVNFQQQQFRQPSYKNLMQANASSMYPLNKITSNNNLANQSMPSNQFSVNLQQKSLSIGNLANLNSKVGLVANSPVNHQISNVNLVKASPSLELNSKQGKLANNGNNNVISSDHSGDNDSGISSMSSETTTMTTTTTTNSSSSSSTSSSSALPGNGIQAGSIPINFVQSMKPQSMHNINSNYNNQMQQFQQRQQQMYINNNGNPLLINSLQNQQQQQYQYQLQLQQQQQQQMNTANSANKPTKSVLETLV